jgi:hypothetical protein
MIAPQLRHNPGRPPRTTSVPDSLKQFPRPQRLPEQRARRAQPTTIEAQPTGRVGRGTKLFPTVIVSATILPEALGRVMRAAVEAVSGG